MSSMYNNIEDLFILRQLGVLGRPHKASKIFPMSWLHPSPDCITN